MSIAALVGFLYLIFIIIWFDYFATKERRAIMKQLNRIESQTRHGRRAGEVEDVH